MITSTSNGKVKEIIKLNTKSKARREARAFLSEGTKMFLEAPREWIREIYVTESFAKENADILAGHSFEMVSEQVMKHMADTKTPQGILCVMKMPDYQLPDIIGDTKNTMLLVLEGIQDPGNLGTMFRTAEGAGATGILMDNNTVDIFNPKTIRSTMGSVYRMPFLYTDTLKETLLQLQKQGVHFYAAHLKGKKHYDEADYCQPTGFLIGNEGNGLSDETAELADTYIRIPMEGKLESLNAAMAAGILMYEGSRQRRTGYTE